jgi:hypothetical protein
VYHRGVCSFTNSARIEFEASNWNTYLFLSLGSKTGAALQSVTFEEWQQWRQQ